MLGSWLLGFAHLCRFGPALVMDRNESEYMLDNKKKTMSKELKESCNSIYVEVYRCK